MENKKFKKTGSRRRVLILFALLTLALYCSYMFLDESEKTIIGKAYERAGNEAHECAEIGYVNEDHVSAMKCFKEVAQHGKRTSSD